MTWGELQRALYDYVSSAGGSELIDSTDIKFFINMALGRAESLATWNILKEEKTITPASPATTFTLPAELYNIYTVKIGNEEESLEEVKDNPGEGEYAVFFNTLKIGTTAASIKVSGEWGFPHFQNTEEFLATEIALPKAVIAGIYNLCISFILPIYSDTADVVGRINYAEKDI
jgi:hypothetical protein